MPDFGHTQRGRENEAITKASSLSWFTLCKISLRRISTYGTLTFRLACHNSATNSIRSSSIPPPPLEQTRTLKVSSLLQHKRGK